MWRKSLISNTLRKRRIVRVRRSGDVMASYLMTCRCGKTLPVEVGQAGEQIECACGAKLVVPPLRQLRELPVAASAPEVPGRRWSAAQGAVAACLVVAGVLAMAAAWSRWSEPPVHKFSAAQHIRNMDHNVEQLTPAQAWAVWVQAVQPLRDRGFFIIDVGPSPAQMEQIERSHFFQAMMLVIAAVFVAGGVIVAISSKARRPAVGRA